MTQLRSLFLFAGEQSGDLHGASLIRELRQLRPDWTLSGIPGPEMRREGIKGILQVEDFSVMGFADVILSLPKLIRQFIQIRNHILQTKPDAVILIDYPGFNIRMARSLRKKGYTGKIIQYISPSVWAHGKGRIRHMERDLNHLLAIFPFEPKYFSNTKLPVTYTGNPLFDTVENNSNPRAIGDQNLIGIFPGSRYSEIQCNLPLQLEAAGIFAEHHPDARFAVSIANERLRELIISLVSISPIKTKTSIYEPEDRYKLMQNCGYAFATSGTVTMELALHKRPTVVSFVLTPFNDFVLRVIIRPILNYYCIVNIVAGKMVFPEFMRQKPTPELLGHALEALYENPSICLAGCEELRTMLRTPFPAAQTAALKIVELVQ